MSTPGSKVLTNVELLENVLLFLGHVDLTRLQRVSRTCNGVIKTSKRLQKIFAYPLHDPVILERILVHLKLREVLKVQRVSRVWRHSVQKSQIIQQSFFLVPIPLQDEVRYMDRIAATQKGSTRRPDTFRMSVLALYRQLCSGDEFAVNPFLSYGFELLATSEDSICRLSGNVAPPLSNKIWRKQYLTQPPTNSVYIDRMERSWKANGFEVFGSQYLVHLPVGLHKRHPERSEARLLRNIDGVGVTIGDLVNEIRAMPMVVRPLKRPIEQETISPRKRPWNTPTREEKRVIAKERM